MKLIFLDFDGPIIPLQSHSTRRPLKSKAWPEAVAALNRITDVTEASIVVSSSWRTTAAKMRELLSQWGATGEVVGITPVLFQKVDGIWTGVPRGREIGEYLRKRRDVDAFVILDDDTDMEDLEPFLIQTPFEIGLTEENADLAIDMLTRPRAVRLR